MATQPKPALQAPNIETFLEYLESHEPETRLTPYQKDLASDLIAYRVRHHSGGRRSGRTFVVQTVQRYFDVEYHGLRRAGKEI